MTITQPTALCAKAAFGPGTNIPEAAADLVEKLNAQLGYGPKAAAEGHK